MVPHQMAEYFHFRELQLLSCLVPGNVKIGWYQLNVCRYRSTEFNLRLPCITCSSYSSTSAPVQLQQRGSLPGLGT